MRRQVVVVVVGCCFSLTPCCVSCGSCFPVPEHLRKKNVELDVRQLEVPSLEGRVPIHDRNIGVMRMLIYGT